MKTAEEIIEYLETELADAYIAYDETKGKEAQKALEYITKAITIQNLFEGIQTEKAKPQEPHQITPGHLKRMLMNTEITEEEYKKKKAQYVETLFELYVRDIITEEEPKERLNK